jgi:hypothetical protein
MFDASEFNASLLDNIPTSHISGTAPDAVKALLARPTHIFRFLGAGWNSGGNVWGGEVCDRMVVKEVDLGKDNGGEGRKLEIRVVYEVVVTPGGVRKLLSKNLP